MEKNNTELINNQKNYLLNNKSKGKNINDINHKSIPYIIKAKELVILFIIIIIILIILKLIKIKIIDYFSDTLILIIFLIKKDLDSFIVYSSIFCYIIKYILEFSIYKINLDKWICRCNLNILLFWLFVTNIKDYDKKKKKRKNHKKCLNMNKNN